MFALLSTIQIFKLLTKVNYVILLLVFNCHEAVQVLLLLEKENHDHEKSFHLFDRFIPCLNLFLHEEHASLLLLSFEFFNLYLIFILKFSNSIINSLIKFNFILQDDLSLLSIKGQEIE